MKKAKMIVLTHFDTGKDIYLAHDADIVAIETLEATDNFAERTAINGRNNRIYLVKESASTVRKLLGR